MATVAHDLSPTGKAEVVSPASAIILPAMRRRSSRARRSVRVPRIPHQRSSRPRGSGLAEEQDRSLVDAWPREQTAHRAWFNTLVEAYVKAR